MIPRISLMRKLNFSLEKTRGLEAKEISMKITEEEITDKTETTTEITEITETIGTIGIIETLEKIGTIGTIGTTEITEATKATEIIGKIEIIEMKEEMIETLEIIEKIIEEMIKIITDKMLKQEEIPTEIMIIGKPTIEIMIIEAINMEELLEDIKKREDINKKETIEDLLLKSTEYNQAKKTFHL